MGIWRWILRAAVYSDHKRVAEVSAIIRQTRELDVAEFKLLIKNIRMLLLTSRMNRLSARTELDELLQQMRELGLEMTHEIEAEILQTELALDNIERADGIAAGWTKAEEKTEHMWMALLQLAIHKCDRRRVIEVCQMMAEAGVLCHGPGLAYLARREGSSPTTLNAADLLGAVQEAEQLTGCQATARTWEILIKSIIEHSHDIKRLDKALQIYRYARGAGVQVDIYLARVLIGPLCNTSDRTSTQLAQALEVYNDLAISEVSIPHLKARRTMSSIFRNLVFACSYTPSANQAAMRLLEDMQIRGLDLTGTTPEQLCGLVIRFMRHASDHRAAFVMYSTIHSLAHAIFDEKAFSDIAFQFATLSWETSPIAPLNLFIEMIKNMHRAGFQPGTRLLTTLLHQYGQVARTVMSQSSYEEADETLLVRREILKAIEGLHTRIKLDPLINIDVPLLNALMAAYSHVGSWSSAFDVWEDLVERRSREPAETVQKDYEPSISIILDTCGHTSLPYRARKVWAWARRHHLTESTRIWDGYVECLCRCDEMDQAVELVCVEMKEERDGAMRPGIGSCEILLKFSFRDPVWFELVQKRVREEFPEWWEDLRGIVEKG